jgi:hypothetical protein
MNVINVCRDFSLSGWAWVWSLEEDWELQVLELFSGGAAVSFVSVGLEVGFGGR